MEKKKYFTISDFDSINIECEYSIELIKNNLMIEEIRNIIYSIKKQNKTIYINNIFFLGKKNVKPKITLSYLKNSNNIIFKENAFVSPYDKNKFLGVRFNSKSFIDEINNSKSILYQNIFNYDKFKNSFFTTFFN